ncbi:MAG: hypothetical protein HFH01_09405 [Dorea sp.]|nr:hypothetical protein [Dorea sp.]
MQDSFGDYICLVSIILEEVMELEDTHRYKYEFYRKKIHLKGWRNGEQMITNYNYDYMSSSDTTAIRRRIYTGED